MAEGSSGGSESAETAHAAVETGHRIIHALAGHGGHGAAGGHGGGAGHGAKRGGASGGRSSGS